MRLARAGLVFALLLAGGCPEDRPAGDLGPLSGRGPLQRIGGDHGLAEGPLWRERTGDLLFSDILEDTIYKLTPPAAVTVFRRPSGAANGLAADAHGRLLAAEHLARRVSITTASGAVQTLVDRFEGKRLNSPNDLVVSSDGTIYFTDPPYGIEPQQQELAFNALFRLAPTGTLSAAWKGTGPARPNGVTISPDEKTLYLSHSDEALVRAFDVRADGSLAAARLFVETAGTPDGMTVDAGGNLFVCTVSGVQVFAPSGEAWGLIATPQSATNCAFGGAAGRTLYITTSRGLYSVEL